MRLFVEGNFGYCDVSELTPDERLALLNECDADGWDIAQRGTHPVQQLLPAQSPEEWIECWYFRRRHT